MEGFYFSGVVVNRKNVRGAKKIKWLSTLLLFILFSGRLTAATNVTTISILTGSNPTCSGSSVTFRATNSCATTGVTYQWKIGGVNVPGQTASTFTTTTLTNGAVITCTSSFTGPGGCTGSPTTSNSITMIVNAAPTVNAGGPNTVCQSSTPSPISLSGAGFGGGATTAAWSITSGGGTLSSTAQTTTPSSVTYTPATNYSGTVVLTLTTNAPAGCSPATATRTITVNALPTVNAGSTITVCESATPGSITLSGASFGGGATAAQWTIISGGGTLSSTAMTGSPASVSYTPAGNFSGTVSLTITSNAPAGCAAVSASRTVTINPLPTLTGATQSTAVCEGSSATINLSGLLAGSTNSVSYSINGGAIQTASPVNANGSGNASFTTAVLTSANNGQSLEITSITNTTSGCVESFSQSLTLSVDERAIADAGLPQSVCAGNSITLNGSISGSATTSTWSAASGSFSSVADLNSTFTPFISSGTVTLTLTTNDPSGACPAASDNVLITVNALPAPSVAPASSVCENSTGNVYSTQAGMSNYTWSVTNGTITSGGGATNNTATITWGAPGTGNILINYTDGNGCTANSSINHSFTINPEPTLASAGQNNSVCAGNSAQINLTGLLPNSTSTITYSIGGGASISVTGVVADASGNGSFNTNILALSNDGQTLLITGVTSSAGCTNNFNISIILQVTQGHNLSSSLTPPDICSGTAFSYIPESNSAGATFSWSRSAVSGISQAASSGTGTINETLTNTTANSINVTYSIITSANGCSGAPENVIVTVYPTPSLSSSLSPAAVCSGVTFNYTPTSATSGATFLWTRAAVTGISETAGSGTGNISEELTNTTTAAVSVTYTITTSANGCTGTTQNVVVSIKPIPVLSSTLAPADICSGNTFAYTASSSTTGTTFSWSRAAVAGISQAATTGTGNVSEVLTNTTANPVNVTYQYTLTASGCSNAPQNVVVTVNPKPSLSSTLTPAAICSGTNFSYIPGSATAGATYTWSRAAVAGISQPASNGTNTVNETLTNTTSAAINVTYVFTASANGCTGTPQNVVVSVKPTPVLSSTLSPAAICSGTVFGYTPTSATSGSTFSWNRAAVTGISQATNSGTGTVSETLTNTTPNPVNVTYAYTVTANGCSNTPQNVVVTVKPKPVLSSTLTPPAICSGSAFTYTATSATAATTFSWSKPFVTGITQPAATGTGNVNQILTNTTNSPINVTYNYTLTSNGCTGVVQPVVVTVNPKPNVTNFSTSATTICAGSGSTITVNSTSLGSGTFTFTYNLTDQNVATGNTSSGTISGSSGTFTTSVLNNTANNGSTTITITAVTNQYGCTTPVTAGNVDNFGVDDIPSFVGSTSVTICSGTSVGKFLETDYSNSTITWFANYNHPSITGESLTPQTPANKKINDVLVNLTTVPQTITYTATAASTNQACNGPATTFTITVNPAPTMTSGTSATICSGNSFSIPLTSNMSSTYQWIAQDNPNTTGESLIVATANPMSNTITSAAPTTQTVTYDVNAVSTVYGCIGPAQIVTVTVNPKPVLSSALTSARCDNVSGTYVASSATTGVTFTWNRPVVAGITNSANSGTGTTITETLDNNTSAPVNVNYEITMSANGCSNTQNATVTINPTPTLTSAIQNAVVCAGTAATINLSGLLPSVTSTITYTINGGTTQTVSGVVSNAGGSATFTSPVLSASNDGQILQITGITTTSQTPSCARILSVNTTLEVNPIPTLSSTLNPPAICSGTTFSYTPTSSTSGTTFTWNRAAVAGISQPASSGNGIINQALTNTTSSPVSVTYVVVSTAAGCSNSGQNVVVAVNPECTLSQPANLALCDGDASGTIVFNSTVTGTSCTWTNNNTSIGLGASGSGNISSFTASCTAPSTATITVTPTANGCVGQTRTFTISVRKPGSWTGVVSTDWFDSNNWDCLIVPNATIDVNIPSSAPNMPEINGSGAECRSININPGASLSTIGTNNLDVYGNWINDGGCTHNTGSVSFRGNTTISGSSVNCFHHVIISGSLTACSSNIKVSGNWTNNMTFIDNGGTVTFNGTSIQTIGGSVSSTFNNLTIQSAGVTLNLPVTVNGTLDMVDGRMTTTSTNILSLTNTATTSIGNVNSYVNGPMNYTVAMSGTEVIRNFPIGKDSTWRPAVLSVSHTDATPARYTAEVINSSAQALNYTLPSNITEVSYVRYWQIDRQSVPNFGSAKVQLYYGADDGVTDYANVTVVKTIGSGTEWFDINGTATANGAGSVTSDYFSTFSKFTLGNRLGGTNPLPVELVEFNAFASDNTVDLSWNTASEINNDFFTIERTKDGSRYEEVGRVKGHGTTSIPKSYKLTDKTPYSGRSYYRLKQTDFNGEVYYSDLKEVEMANVRTFTVYPNPSIGSDLLLNLPMAADSDVVIELYEGTGKLIISKTMLFDSNGNGMISLTEDQELAAGIYLMTVKYMDMVLHQKLVRE